MVFGSVRPKVQNARRLLEASGVDLAATASWPTSNAHEALAAGCARDLPGRLPTQLIALLLFALVASQIVTLMIMLDERRHALRTADRAPVLARTASIVRLMEATPTELHPHIVRPASSPRR